MEEFKSPEIRDKDSALDAVRKASGKLMLDTESTITDQEAYVNRLRQTLDQAIEQARQSGATEEEIESARLDAFGEIV